MSAAMSAALGALADRYRSSYSRAFSARQQEGVTPEERGMFNERVRNAEALQREIAAILAAEDDRLEHRKWGA